MVSMHISAPPRRVFVYGTLRRGQSNDILRMHPVPKYLGRARVHGVMYHLGAYPGVVLGGTRWVQGEVYEVTEALERALDVLEGVLPSPTGEYFKREVPVSWAGQSARCLVYEINPEFLKGREEILSGDWCTASP
jgi:gamma-glutamylcyclotransferase (GGCT)/AIG2-like uncharacterized protein YtfP